MDQRVVDGWLRDHGLPTLVPTRRWADDLPRRVAPLQVFLSVLLAGVSVLLWAGGDTATEPDDAVPDLPELLALLAVGAVLLAVPGLLAWLVDRWLQRLPPRRATAVAWAVIAVSAVAGIPAGWLLDPGSGWWSQVWTTAAETAAAFLFVGLGGAALLLWTLRMALYNLGAVKQMASIALPVILLVVVFAFFSTEMWQMTDAMSWSRLFGVGLLLAVVGAVVVLPAVARAALDTAEPFDDAERRILLDGLGLPTGPMPARPLTRLQRGNVLLVMVVAQLLLGAVFALAQAALLVLLGDIALTQEAVVTWVGHVPEQAQIGRTTLPVTVNLLKTSLLLGMIATLSFVISAVNDARYREHFFDPILDEVREALVVRNASRG